MSDTPRTVYIVSHTHWDREWYMTYHQFRVNLTRIVGRILDALEADDGFNHFLLDGQTIILEDYLEVCPQDRERIARHVSAGTLSIGPWYILPDEFLVSGESTVRNLLIGRKVGSAFGRVQNAGYMPDSFGHIAQIPQLLRGAGIDSFIFTRGLGDEIDDLGHEFIWRAPDGSEVLALNQCEGYCNGGGLGFDEIWHAHTRRKVNLKRALEQTRELFAKMSRHSNGDIYLVNNGCDHFPPQQEFDAIVGALREAYPDTEFIHTGLEEVVAAVRDAGIATKTFSGELSRSRLSQVFPGVWSARMYLKQHNDRCQTLLERYLEPISAYTHFVHGLPYPSGSIEYAWKLLMQNHPHDSICGCSTDDVHRDMIPRFDGVAQTAEQELARQLEELTHTFARDARDDRDTVLTVVNPLPIRRTEIITRLVPLQPLGYSFDTLRLVDETGNDVPFRVLDRKTVERFWGIDYRVEPFYERQRETFAVYARDFADRILKPDGECDTYDTFLTIQFIAEDLPALGHANFRLEDRRPVAHTPPESTVTIDDNTIENEHLRITVYPNGTFDLEHKATGAKYTNLNRLEDTEDVGDEYDYSPADDSLTVTSDDSVGRVHAIEDSGWRATLEAEFTMTLPASIDPSSRRHRARETVECPVRVSVGITHRSPLVSVVTQFDNNADDHRLRAHFPTAIAANTVISDGHFYINERNCAPPSARHWSQPPGTTVPQQDFSLVSDGENGLAIFNKGLPEFEVLRRDGGSTLALTLLRAVGWLSRDDFPHPQPFQRRPHTLHPRRAVPGATTLRVRSPTLRRRPCIRRRENARLSLPGAADVYSGCGGSMRARRHRIRRHLYQHDIHQRD